MIFLTMLVNIKQQNNEETDNCSSTSVTDGLLCILHYHLQQKHIQVIKSNYKKKWNLCKNSQTVKKVQPMQKKIQLKGDLTWLQICFYLNGI